jgi:hypothetical protein
MSWMGWGKGDYVKYDITYTHYEYVGKGRGVWALIPQTKTIFCFGYCCGAFIFVALIFAIFFWWPSPPTTTTTNYTPTPPPPPRPTKWCIFWGDPHIKTFDGGRPSFYGEGEYWILKSRPVLIQGRFMGTPYTHGLSATNKIAVGGPFLQGHKIQVGTLEEGDFSMDGRPLCVGQFPCHVTLPNGLGSITYDGQGPVVDPEGTADWPKKVVRMRLPNGVHIAVFRWANYIDLKITLVMAQFGNHTIDGACGNFNADPMDDTTAAIIQRVGARVSPPESLFDHHAVADLTPEMYEMLQQKCDVATRSTAESTCHATLPGAAVAMVQSCVYDMCFGHMAHAREVAKTFA